MPMPASSGILGIDIKPLDEIRMKLFVRDLTVIDASYLDAERGFVGESYQVDIVIQGSLNEQSMILDFSSVKKQIKAIIMLKLTINYWCRMQLKIVMS